VVLDEPLKRYENYLREARGVQLNYGDTRGNTHTTYEFLYSIIIPILMLFPALIAGSIVIDTVSEKLENKISDTLVSTPLSLNVVIAAKISAAVIIATIQCFLWTGLLRLSNIFIHNTGSVLLLSVILAAIISVGTAIIALCFKDREGAQFVYSTALIAVAGGSYFLEPSPFNLITRLSAGDLGLGIAEVMLYSIPLIAMSAVLFFVSRKCLPQLP
jgi:ABC-type Na+ efflux pump permease subunit